MFIIAQNHPQVTKNVFSVILQQVGSPSNPISNASSTVVAITGKTATPEGKKASVKVSFKAKKTGKTSKYSYVSKVSVIEDKLTMTAKVTGVKTIVAEFNKAIADASKVKVTVKKGTATRDCKATVDGSKITLAMDTKLMAGTYTVSVEGVDTTAMTADVVVEKNETLTKFEISPNLTMASSTATDSAVCYYSALNQYDEPMVADQPQVSSSFSSGSDTNIKRVATASVKGIIEIKKIPTVLAIQGTEGTIVLVDKNSGVNTSAKVKISPAATAAEATVVGTYNTSASKMETITAGAELSNYYILLTVKDQYGDEVGADDFKKVANISLAGGLTKVEKSDDKDKDGKETCLTSVAVDGKEYIAIKLHSGKAVAGTYTMTIVNQTRGLLSSGTYDVADAVVVNSVSISPKNGVYNNTDNEMEYSIVDKNGKEITSYATLKALVHTDGKILRWEKKSDGTAKLIYNPGKLLNPSVGSDTASTLGTITVYANEPTSSNYIVKTFTFTVSKERKIKTVQGLAADTTTSVARGNTLKIDLNKIVYADQYSNKVTKDDTDIYAKTVKVNDAVPAKTTGCSIVFAPVDGAFAGQVGYAKLSDDKKSLEFMSSKAGTVNVYLKYSDEAAEAVTASADKCDFKFTVTATDTSNVATTSLKIKSVNDGFVVTSAGALELKPEDIEVVGIIGGTQTKIPTTQYVIKENKNNTFTRADENAGTETKTATVIVQVTTWDADNNTTETELSADYTVSTKKSEVFKLIGTDAAKLASATKNTALKATDFQNCFTFEDQYNTYKSAGKMVKDILGGDKVAGNVTYSINVVNGEKDAYRVTGDGTNGASLVFTKDAVSGMAYTVKVTATVNGASKTAECTITVK